MPSTCEGISLPQGFEGCGLDRSGRRIPAQVAARSRPPCLRFADENCAAHAGRMGRPRPLTGSGESELLAHQLAVADAVRLIGVHAEPAFAVGFVVLVVALEPNRLAVALESENVGRDAVEEPAVV